MIGEIFPLSALNQEFQKYFHSLMSEKSGMEHNNGDPVEVLSTEKGAPPLRLC